MPNLRSTVILSMALVACASAPVPRTTASPPPAAREETRRGEPGQPLAPQTAAAPVTPGDFQGMGGAAVSDPIAHWQSVIDQDENSLAAGLTECRQICTAAANICVAAREICRLTEAADARCGRARAACADAGQRRDTACAVCPQ